jgi:hypothetical protein
MPSSEFKFSKLKFWVRIIRFRFGKMYLQQLHLHLQDPELWCPFRTCESARALLLLQLQPYHCDTQISTFEMVAWSAKNLTREKRCYGKEGQKDSQRWEFSLPHTHSMMQVRLLFVICSLKVITVSDELELLSLARPQLWRKGVKDSKCVVITRGG